MILMITLAVINCHINIITLEIKPKSPWSSLRILWTPKHSPSLKNNPP